MRIAQPGVAVVAGLAALVCGCGVRPADTVAGASRSDRVLEITTRLPGELPAAATVAVARDVTTDGAFAGLGDAAALDAPVDARLLVPADRLDPRLPSITVAFSGDTLIHSPLVRGALAYGGGTTYDFSPMFAEVAPIIGAADLAICHLESPIVPDGEELSTFPRYGVPPEIVGAIAGAGYDRCSTASNHSLDRGFGGIDATVGAFDRYGIGESGMARTPAEAVAPILQVGGIMIAHLSYSFGFNGIPFPADEPWRTNEIDPARIIADAVDARVRGAQVVIVSLHWGAEGASAVTPYQRSVAEAVTASGTVDLIVGHHAHVIQPIEQVNGRWVVFGMGNFLSNMPFEHTWTESSQDGVIIEITIDERADGTFSVGRPVALPTWVDKDHGWVIRPVLTELADPSTSAGLRGQLYASLLRTAKVLAGFVPGT